jgi:hypothetical protein
MFVVLEHTVPTAEGVAVHWDFLIELAGQERLAAWRLARDPLASAGSVPAERLPDHRPLYLDFEGELSGNRGRVRRVERGSATIERLAGDEVSVLLEGTRLRGRFEITVMPRGGAVFQACEACGDQ